MAKIYISHSSKDKDFARQLASDLSDLGYEPWLDEWEIKVGECIVTRIGDGIAEADYVVIVLSPSSVKSGWVEREWKAKYWDEIEQNKTFVLPTLIENCEIQQLLKTKKYADFRKKYSVGLVQLMSSISPVITKPGASKDLKTTMIQSEISTLLSKLQSRAVPLSECVAEALTVAQKAKNSTLEKFCRNELIGWEKQNVEKLPDDQKPLYRLIEAFASPFHEINLQYMGWSSASSIFDEMRRDKENYFPVKMVVSHPISQLESGSKSPYDPQKAVITFRAPLKDFLPNTKTPDTSVIVYAPEDSFSIVLERIRSELTKQLLDLLPPISHPTN